MSAKRPPHKTPQKRKEKSFVAADPPHKNPLDRYRPWEKKRKSLKSAKKTKKQKLRAQVNLKVSGAEQKLQDIMDEAKEKFQFVGRVERRGAKADEKKQLEKV